MKNASCIWSVRKTNKKNTFHYYRNLPKLDTIDAKRYVRFKEI